MGSSAAPTAPAFLETPDTRSPVEAAEEHVGQVVVVRVPPGWMTKASA